MSQRHTGGHTISRKNKTPYLGKRDLLIFIVFLNQVANNFSVNYQQPFDRHGNQILFTFIDIAMCKMALGSTVG